MLVLDCMYLGFIWLLVGFDVGFCVDLDVCSIRFFVAYICFFMLLLCWLLFGFYVAFICVNVFLWVRV